MKDALLERVAAGESRAVEACITRYGALVWALARKLSPTLADAEDAVQEIFFELWRSAARYNPQIASEKTFVTMVARRRLIDRRRRSQRRPALTGDGGQLLAEVPAPSDAAPAPLSNDPDEVRRARDALAQLRPAEQDVLRLTICEGWSHSRTAEQLGLPLGTVKTHARRGLIRLRTLLGADEQAQTGGVAQ